MQLFCFIHRIWNVFSLDSISNPIFLIAENFDFFFLLHYANSIFRQSSWLYSSLMYVFFLLSSFYSIHCAPVNSLSASLHGIVIVLSTFHTHSVRFHSSHAIQCAEHTIVEQLTEFSVDDYDRRNRTHEMSKSLSSSICSHFRFLKIVSTSIFSRFEVKCYHKKWIFCRSIPNRPFIIVVFIKHSSKCFTHVHLTNTIHT